MKKATLLIIFLLGFSNHAKSEDFSFREYFNDSRKNIIKDEYHCFSDLELNLMAKEIQKSEACQMQLSEYKIFAEENFESQPDLAFWQEPVVIIGGVTVSIAVGIMIGYIVAL